MGWFTDRRLLSLGVVFYILCCMLIARNYTSSYNVKDHYHSSKMNGMDNIGFRGYLSYLENVLTIE